MAARAYNQQKEPLDQRGGAIDSIAVSIHWIDSRSQGTQTFSYAAIVKELEQANQVFAGAGIAFFICGSPRIQEGEAIYDFSTGDQLNQQAYLPNTINIYFVNSILTSEGPLCGYAQFPFFGRPQDRYILMNKSCATDGATLIHELGHFYGLFHTHETAFGKEYVIRSNCETAGDRFCDTAADPNLANPGVMNGCTYVGALQDQMGSYYIPPVSNFMSYAPSACQRIFSPQQRQTIRSIHEQQNSYLTQSCDHFPDFGITTGQQAFTVRSDEILAASYSIRQVNLERGYHINLKIFLANEPNAEGLLLHRERLLLEPGKNSFPLDFELALPAGLTSGNYYLQALIDADQEVIEKTEGNNLVITPLTIDNSALGNSLLFPNPAQNEVKLFIRDKRATGALNIRIFRYDGSLIRSYNGFKSQEEFFYFLNVADLQSGFYLITVGFERRDNRYNFKLYKQ